MKIHGYTEEKQVVRVDLPVEEIVAAGIDPWRLDLFDQQPVMHIVNGRMLWFRRLTDFTCAYVNEDGSAVLIRDDGKQKLCLEARWHLRKHLTSMLLLDGLEESTSSFSKHLSEYLSLPMMGVFDAFFSSTRQQHTQCSLYPSFDEALTITADELRLEPGSVIDPNQAIFIGEMLATRTLQVYLDPRINFVFQTFRQWRPKIEALAIRHCLFGKRPALVRVVLDKGGIEAAFEKFYTRRTGSRFSGNVDAEFEHDSCKYMIREIGRTKDDPIFFDPTRYSADYLCSIQSDEIQCGRIALYDLAHKQFRALEKHQFDLNESGAKSLQEEGLTLCTGLEL